MAVKALDVLVVGGGPAGSAVAMRLARSGVAVGLVERAATPPERVGEVLPPAAGDALVRLGVWNRFVADVHLPSAGVSLWWGNDCRKDWNYLRSGRGFSNGWHIDRQRFEASMLETAREAGTTLYLGARVRSVAWQPGRGWLVTADGGAPAVWQPRLLIYAAGRAQLLRHITGRRLRFDRQVGVVRYFSRPDEGDAAEPRIWLETTPVGWCYSAPLPRGRLIAAFVTDADLLRTPLVDWFTQRLKEAPHSAARLARCTPASVLHVFPADTSRLPRFAGEAFLAIGDAAFTTDPARGQGIINALRSAESAAVATVEFLSGRSVALAGYANWVEGQFHKFTGKRPAHHQMEARWPNAPFWQRRAAVPGA
jgi:flavin-dependent dehydrogenase